MSLMSQRHPLAFNDFSTPIGGSTRHRRDIAPAAPSARGDRHSGILLVETRKTVGPSTETPKARIPRSEPLQNGGVACALPHIKRRNRNLQIIGHASPRSKTMLAGVISELADEAGFLITAYVARNAIVLVALSTIALIALSRP